MRNHTFFPRLASSAAALGVFAIAVRADSITRFEYDQASQVTRRYVEDSAGQTILSESRMEYDALGRVTQLSELADPGAGPNPSADRVTETLFDKAGNVVERRQRASGGDAITLYAYDFANRQTMMTDPAGAVSVYEYDHRGNVARVVDPVGNQSEFTFDAAGRQTIEERYDQTTLALRVVSEYDSRDNKVKETALSWDATPLTQHRWEFDALGRNTRTVEMADPSSSGAYDTATDRVSDRTYQSASMRLLAETTYAGDPAVARTTSYEYDDIGRLTTIIDPNGNTEQRVYNEFSQVVDKTVSEPTLDDRTFSYFYDDLGRMTSELADGTPALDTEYRYDALDRRTLMVDAAGTSTSYEFNAFGEQTRMTEDDGDLARVTEAAYNQLGHLVQQRTWDGQGLTETTTYSNDKLGRRTQVAFPDGGTYVYEYDGAGRMTRRTDPRGQVSTYTHNWRGQALTKEVDAALQEEFDYDALGRMTLARRNVDNFVEFAYDAFGQLTWTRQMVDALVKTITYEYNQAGDRTRIVYPSDTGVDLALEYGGLGQATRLSDNAQTLAEYAYAGRALVQRSVRTLNPTPTWIRHIVEYDVHRRPTSIRNVADVNGVVTELDRYDYEYDTVGNRTKSDIAGDQSIVDTIDYGYDSLHRLTSAGYAADVSAEQFDYDLLGNRLTYTERRNVVTTYTHNNVNEYTDITPGSNAPEYDAAGNLTRTENGYRLTYDYENRLTEVKDPSNATLATYAYDALGRRVHQIKSGESTRFYYDADNVIAEYDGAGVNALERYYVHGPTYVDEHVLINDRGAEYYYLLTALYSVSGLATNAGQVAVRYTYDAYGLPHVIRPSGPGSYGDYDHDGDVDAADAAAFDNCTYTPEEPACAVFDFDRDDDLDYYDYIVFQAYLETGILPGDFDTGGDIDLADYGRLFACFSGPEPQLIAKACGLGDFDGDSDIDLTDLGAFLTYFGIASVTPIPANSYYFTGRELDFDLRDVNGAPVFALYHYRARTYDPWHGRFCQRDPELHSESINLYQYVLSSPLVRFDPTGMFSLPDIMGASGLAIDIQTANLDVSVSLLGAIRGLTDILSERNMMLDALLGMTLYSPDTAGIDYAIGVYSAYQFATISRLAGGFLKAGLSFAVRGATFLVRQGKRAAAAFAALAQEGLNLQSVREFLGRYGTQEHHVFFQYLQRALGVKSPVGPTVGMLSGDHGNLHHVFNALYPNLAGERRARKAIEELISQGRSPAQEIIGILRDFYKRAYPEFSQTLELAIKNAGF